MGGDLVHDPEADLEMDGAFSRYTTMAMTRSFGGMGGDRDGAKKG